MKNTTKSPSASPSVSMMNIPCSECGGKLKRKAITQEFEKEGVTVKLSGVKAWVCQRCGEIYFEPGGAEKVAEAVRCLFNLALVEKQHKGGVRAAVS